MTHNHIKGGVMPTTTETQVTTIEAALAVDDVKVTETKTFATLEEALAEIKRKEDNERRLLDEKAQVKRKLSKFESDAAERDAKLLEEQGKFKELFEKEKTQREALEQRMKDDKVNSAMKVALLEAQVRSPDTVMKLVDKSLVKFDDNGNIVPDSVKAAVETIRKADPVLFGSANLGIPQVLRASEGITQDTYKTEVAAAKNAKELAAIYEKYKAAGKF